jgi:hypothetical protein
MAKAVGNIGEPGHATTRGMQPIRGRAIRISTRSIISIGCSAQPPQRPRQRHS